MNSWKATKACLDGLEGCEDTIDGQDGRMTGLMWAGCPQPRCGWVFLWARTQGRPRSSANPGLPPHNAVGVGGAAPGGASVDVSSCKNLTWFFIVRIERDGRGRRIWMA
jgi:hypothetical protein